MINIHLGSNFLKDEKRKTSHEILTILLLNLVHFNVSNSQL